MRRRRRNSRLRFLVITFIVAVGAGLGASLYLPHLLQSEPTDVVFAQMSPLGEEIEEPSLLLITPYEAYQHYIAENHYRYTDFHNENPHLRYDEVIWMVNVGQYGEPFYDYTVTHLARPLLINPHNKLPYDFIPHELVNFPGSDLQLTPETLEAFFEFRRIAHEEEGFMLWVSSAYRSVERQTVLYANNTTPNAVAKPGFSEHHTGRAIDLGGPDGLLDRNSSTPLGRWVAANAHRFGFIVRYTEENRHITGYIAEPWHITYVGFDIANSIFYGEYQSLEEYVGRHPELISSGL